MLSIMLCRLRDEVNDCVWNLGVCMFILSKYLFAQGEPFG